MPSFQRPTTALFFPHEEADSAPPPSHVSEIPGVPTILRAGPYRFFFYSNEGTEAPHVHVEREARVAKIWLRPVKVCRSGGLPPHELRRIETIVRVNREDLLREWKAFFDVPF